MEPYIHHIPGRMRIKHAGFKSDPAKQKELAAALESMAGVESVTVNPVTGSVVVLYDSESMPPERLECLLKDKGYEACKKVAENGKKVPDEVKQACRILGRKALGLAVERALKGTGFSFLAVLI